MTDHPITVLLADDHILVRRGFRRLPHDLDVVVHAEQRLEAVAQDGVVVSDEDAYLRHRDRLLPGGAR